MCHRVDPRKCDFSEHTLISVREAMEDIDELSGSFEFIKAYESPEKIKKFIAELVSSEQLTRVTEAVGKKP